MKLEMRKFDMKTIKDGATIALIGRRGSGKSIATADIFRYHTEWPIGVVMSATERANHFFEKFIPKMLIYDKFDPVVLRNFMLRQEKITDQREMEIRKYGRSDIDNRAFLVLDDCLYDKSWPNNEDIRAVFMNGRHYGITFIVTMQYPLGIPPHLRANIDYVFIFRDNMIKNRERIYQQYAGMLPNFDTFNQVMDQSTENYECLVINQRGNSNKLEDQLYWYKADTNINFRCCSRELWNIQAADEERKALGMANEGDDEEDFDPTIIRKVSAKTPKIRVHKVDTR